MIKLNCFTNLDLWNEKWPKELPALPNVGNIIMSNTIHCIKNNNFQLSLKIVSVSWITNGIDSCWSPLIELHDYRNRSIDEFFEWYAPLVGKTKSSFI